MMFRRSALCLPVLVGALILTGCSNDGKPAPTSPTATAPSSSSAGIDLTVATPAGTPGAGVNAPVVGTVAQTSGTCPDVTFVLSGVTIHASATTRFESGACADLKDGVRAGAMGAKRADGSVDAARIKVAPEATPPAHVEGAVVGPSGTCPALTFTLSGTPVRTSDKTTFDGGACGDIKEGVRAGATGPKDASGTLDATRVKIAPPPLPHVEGQIAGLSGACPSLTFTLSGTTVRTSDKTRFQGGACGDVKPGIRAGAAGAKASDGSLDATVVKIGS